MKGRYAVCVKNGSYIFNTQFLPKPGVVEWSLLKK
jgi:hypothetical protein